MTLNDSQSKLIFQKLKVVLTGDRPCPICSKSIAWDISGVYQIQQYNEGNHCPGAPIAPMILVTCRTCGHTILFNAIALGVVDWQTGQVKEAK